MAQQSFFYLFLILSLSGSINCLNQSTFDPCIKVLNSITVRDLQHQTKSYCIVDFSNSTSSTQEQYFPFNFDNSSNLCNSKKLTPNKKQEYFIFNYVDACSAEDQIESFDIHYPNAIGLLFNVTCSLNLSAEFNFSKEYVRRLNFSLSVIISEDISNIHNFKQMTRHAFIDEKDKFKYTLPMFFILLIAVSTVVIGSYWSGIVRNEIFIEDQKSLDNLVNSDKGDKSKKQYREHAYSDISTYSIIFLVICMISSIMLLYFFYKYLVYIIIFIFILSTMISLFFCLSSFANFSLSTKITKLSIQLKCFSKSFSITYLDVLFLIVSIGLPIWWFVCRHNHSYAWILQDILGFVFCVNMLRTLRLPSFKICVLLMVTLFFYDIFFVFITPLITSQGKSIMVEVATGGSGDSNVQSYRCKGKPVEILPMLFRVPKLLFNSNPTDAFDVCYSNVDSLLGFGDVMIPGLLVSYSFAYDLIRKVPYKLYFVASSISYVVGLITTFTALFLMKGAAQPALLYLVPCTLIPVFVISLVRNEVRQFWNGPEYLIDNQLVGKCTEVEENISV